MSTEAGRLAAYADLVAALLDLRDPGPSAAFDAAIDQALAGGALTTDQARRLRWLQRETLRRLVEHAQTVLPATLVALESEPTSGALPEPLAAPPIEPLTGPLTQPLTQPLTGPAATATAEPPLDLPEPLPEPPPEPLTLPDPPADLQARRLLVAGLRPLPDGPRRGTLP